MSISSDFLFLTHEGHDAAEIKLKPEAKSTAEVGLEVREPVRGRCPRRTDQNDATVSNAS